MNKALLIFACLVMRSPSLYAQATLHVLDAESGDPVAGVQLHWQSLTNADRGWLLSSEAGKIEGPWNGPVHISISHVAYHQHSDTIAQGNYTISLQPSLHSLHEIVVTGQFSPQDAKSSVYQVRTISRDRMVRQGATQLEHVLQNELNFAFRRDNALGSSSISLQGISGQNVKILLDGVPLVGRSGVNNQIDLNQVNIHSIERIEIVEGPMAVQFGADALAGVINIITRKDSDHTWNIALVQQEESVGNSYNLWDEGIHNTSLSAGYRPSEKWLVQAEGSRNYFGGWVGSGTPRNRQWYPKTQYFGSGLVRFAPADQWDIQYRFDYMNEVIENLGEVNDNNPQVEPFALDEEFITHRWMHQLQAEIPVGDLSMHPVLSYSDYSRRTRQFFSYLLSNDEQLSQSDEQDTIYYKTLFFRNTLHGIQGEWGQLQIGMDGNYERAAGTTLSNGEKNLTEAYGFLSAEFRLGNKVMLRPGVRYGYNSLFAVQPTPSLNIKYQPNTHLAFRIGYGRGFRAPSLREMYHEFIDINHFIIGNENLSPEYSHNVNLDITRQIFNKRAEISFAAFYNDISDRISYFTPVENNPNQATTYTNISRFKTTGIRLTGQGNIGPFRFNTGAAYMGRYQELSEETPDVPAFVFGWEANAMLSYEWAKSGTTLSTFYKFYGANKDYRLVNEDGNAVPRLQQINAFHLLDATLLQPVSNRLSFTAGVKNLFNIRDIVNTFTSGGAHGEASGATSVSYGRSYFLQLNFNFHSNN